MSIALCGFDGAVAEYLLYVAAINALIKEAGGKGMAEHVRGNMLLYAGSLHIVLDNGTHRLF